MTQLAAAIRRVARVVPDAPTVIARVCHAHDDDDPGKPRIACDDEQARARLVDGLVGDARRLQALPDGDRDPAETDAMELLALIAGQDVEWVADPDTPAGGTWVIARQVGADRVISVHDPDSRRAHKTTARRQDGFKAHVVVEPDAGLVTACAVTRAAGEGSGDAAAGRGQLEQVALCGDQTPRLSRAAAGSGRRPRPRPARCNRRSDKLLAGRNPSLRPVPDRLHVRPTRAHVPALDA